MGKWVHRVNQETRLCACGSLAQKKRVRWICRVQVAKWKNRKPKAGWKPGRPGYRKYKKNSCEICGFVAYDPCQLDIDHINGDSSDHRPENLWTLCSNCHRYKTRIMMDGPYKHNRPTGKIR